MSGPVEVTSVPVGGPEWIARYPQLAYPYMVIAGTAAIVGFIGNILVLLTVAMNRKLQDAKNVFLVNLALADTMVTSIADPFSIVGKFNIQLHWALLTYFVIRSICVFPSAYTKRLA